MKTKNPITKQLGPELSIRCPYCRSTHIRRVGSLNKTDLSRLLSGEDIEWPCPKKDAAFTVKMTRGLSVDRVFAE